MGWSKAKRPKTKKAAADDSESDPEYGLDWTYSAIQSLNQTSPHSPQIDMQHFQDSSEFRGKYRSCVTILIDTSMTDITHEL